MEESNVQNQENQSKKSNPDGYNRAILLIQGQVQLFWLIFGAFLLSETVLLGAITSIDKEDSGNLIFWGSVFGLILSFFWWTTFQYNHAFYRLRIYEARAFEPTEGDFFTHGNTLFNGEPILGVKIPKYVRLLRPKISLGILIGLYAIVFIFIGLVNCPWIGKSC
jgi:hypothetical protein